MMQGMDAAQGRQVEARRLQRGERQGQRLPHQGLRRGDLPHLRGAAGPVQQVHQRVPGADDGGDGDDRRVPRPADHRPALRHRHVRHRHDRACRRGREQQHRADRHLRPAARRRLEQDGRGAADLPRARPPGRADGGVGHPRRAADRLRAGAGAVPPRDHVRRAVDAMVGGAVQRHRLRAGLRHRADAGGDALGADGVHAREPGRRRAAQPAVAAVAARQAGRRPRPRPTKNPRKASRSNTRRPPNSAGQGRIALRFLPAGGRTDARGREPCDRLPHLASVPQQGGKDASCSEPF